MRKRRLTWGLTASGLVMAALLFPAARPVIPLQAPEKQERFMPPVPDQPLRYEAPADLGAVSQASPTLADRLLMKVDPEWLEKYQGAYTLDELRSGDDASGLSLSSAWLIPGSATPQFGVKLEKDPESSDYSVSGGKLFLPGPGIGVSYEEIGETGEQRTFLEIERRF